MRENAQNFGGMAFGFDQGPDALDLAGFTDEEGAANDAHEFAAHELFLLPRAKLLNGRMGRIAEKREIKILLGLEGGLGFYGVGTEAQDGDVELVEFLFCVTKLGRFDGSTGSAGFGIEEDQDALAGEVLEGKRGAVIGGKTEGGSFGAGLEHGNISARARWTEGKNTTGECRTKIERTQRSGKRKVKKEETKRPKVTTRKHTLTGKAALGLS